MYTTCFEQLLVRNMKHVEYILTEINCYTIVCISLAPLTYVYQDARFRERKVLLFFL